MPSLKHLSVFYCFYCLSRSTSCYLRMTVQVCDITLSTYRNVFTLTENRKRPTC